MIRAYIHDRRFVSIALGFYQLVFVVVLFLFRLPVIPVLYACILSFVMTAIYMVYDFYRYWVKYKTLVQSNDNFLSIEQHLKEPESHIEEAYQTIIIHLIKQYQDMVSCEDSKRTEMIDFYTMWVHQIKTPIAAASLLVQEQSGKQSIKMAQELLKIQQYTDLVLNYLRIDDMSKDLVLEACDMEKLINRCIKKFALIFISKGIVVNITDVEETIISDEKWLVFVMEQIISNSLKYTETGSISIYIRKHILYIEDTGIGILPEDLPRIFEKSFTGYNGRLNKQSTGLGLYLCKKILDKMHHSIVIESEVGVGTQVKINLLREDRVYE